MALTIFVNREKCAINSRVIWKALEDVLVD